MNRKETEINYYLPELKAVQHLFEDFNLRPPDKESALNIAEKVFIDNLSTLQLLGLSISVPKEINDIFPIPKKDNNDWIEVDLLNHNLFLNFLESLKTEDVSRFNLEPGLHKISANFASQISQQYVFFDESLSDEIIQVLIATPKIVAQYQRLHLETDKLEVYSHFIKNKRIGIYLSVEHEGLAKNISDAENVTDWVDLPSTEFFDRFHEAMYTVWQLKSSDEEEIYKIAKDKLLNIINAGISTLEQSKGYLDKSRINFLIDLRRQLD